MEKFTLSSVAAIVLACTLKDIFLFRSMCSPTGKLATVIGRPLPVSSGRAGFNADGWTAFPTNLLSQERYTNQIYLNGSGVAPEM
jgi:hypothetical protein